jgi:hypothetical protein
VSREDEVELKELQKEEELQCSNKKQIKPQQAGLRVCRPVLVGSHWEPRFSDRLSYREMAGIITGDNRTKNRIDGSHLGENQVSLLFLIWRTRSVL